MRYDDLPARTPVSPKTRAKVSPIVLICLALVVIIMGVLSAWKYLITGGTGIMPKETPFICQKCNKTIWICVDKVDPTTGAYNTPCPKCGGKLQRAVKCQSCERIFPVPPGIETGKFPIRCPRCGMTPLQAIGNMPWRKAPQLPESDVTEPEKPETPQQSPSDADKKGPEDKK